MSATWSRSDWSERRVSVYRDERRRLLHTQRTLVRNDNSSCYGLTSTSTLERYSIPVMRVPLSLTRKRTQVAVSTW
jgi:hypothetical protein